MKKLFLLVLMFISNFLGICQTNVTTTTPFGTIGYIPKFTTNQYNIQNSSIFENATNIGIGITTPLAKFDVRGSGAFITKESSYNYDFNTPTTYSYSFALHHRIENGVAGNLILSRYWYADNNTRASVIYHSLNSANNDCLAFNVTGGGGSYSNIWSFSAAKMVIYANGSVGIGLSTPSSSTLLSLKGKGSTSATLSLNITNSNDVNMLYVRDDGKVGIGLGSTTFPTDYLLAVGGKIIAEEVKIKLKSQWPDFVFDNSYEMMSLLEVEKYINENKHLPNVPSANEVKENGISVGEMNVILVQKDEELTLYAIQMNKKMELIENKMQELEKKLKNNK